ncbi:MAG: hypothetical protein ABIF10_01790 [Candidatus Woesearchaeota archaeon]
MGKAKLKKKILGLQKQTKKHLAKFREAYDRGSKESMEYMARELADYLRQRDKLMKLLLPKKRRK